MEKVKLNVNGMSCQHCVNSIKKAVGALDGVSEVDVSLEGKTVTVNYDASKVTVDNIKFEIDDQGYEVV